MRTILACIATVVALFCVRPAHAAPEHYTDRLFCLARVVYAEARNQPLEAQYDVALSVLNRVRLNRPDGVRVPQYTGIVGGDAWRPAEWDAWFKSLNVAYKVLSGKVVAHGMMRHALYYLVPKDSMQNARSWFERHLWPLLWSGAHRFYGEYPKIKMAKR